MPGAPGTLGEELKLSSGANTDGDAESPEANVEGPVGAVGEALFRPVSESHLGAIVSVAETFQRNQRRT
jgi:hypothetical protein